MAINMFDATVTPCVRALTNLNAILVKAEAYTTELNIDQGVLLNARLFPDMLPLTMQVVIAGDIARGGAARLAGAEVPKFEAGKATFGELKDGVKRSIKFIESLKPDQFQGAEDRTVTWSTRSSTKSMQGMPYLFNHVLPNVFFHCTTAYDILRQAGLNIGKTDYLGSA
jgi:uncharacterized protein